MSRRQKIRLGPLPRTESVKLTITVPIALKTQLELYAQLHSATWNERVEAMALIPLMLQQFIERDRAFKTALKRTEIPESDLSPES